MTSVTSAGAVHLGMDTSKETIVVAVLGPGEDLPAVDRIVNREEAVRRLIGRFGDRGRVRAAVLADRKRAQQRLTAMLMRHGRIWREGSYWSKAHRAWIAAQSFTEPALATALAFYRATLD